MFISIKYHDTEYSRAYTTGNYLQVSSSVVNLSVYHAVHKFLGIRYPERHFELAEIIIKPTTSKTPPPKLREEDNDRIAFS